MTAFADKFLKRQGKAAKDLAAVFLWLMRLETVELARLAKEIETELARRAEYALRYGTSAPR